MLCVVAVVLPACASQDFSRSSPPISHSLTSSHVNRTVPIPESGVQELQVPAAMETNADTSSDRASASTAQTHTVEDAASEHELVTARRNPALMRLVRELNAGIERCPRSRGLPHIVSLGSLRNMSHASPREFDALRARLADLLNAAAAAEGSSLQFVAGEADESPFTMLGAAYIATIEGFDAWELFISVSRRSVPHDLWRSDGPVRMLRFEQPMAAQVFYGTTARP